MPGPVVAPVRRAFRALASTIVPEATRLDERGWLDVEGVIEQALATRPAGMHRQLRLFVRVLQLLPVLRYGRPFTRLCDAERVAFLEGIQRSRLLLVRRGFWGLRTLVFLGFYARAAGAAEIGYRADARGWDARAAAGHAGGITR